MTNEEALSILAATRNGYMIRAEKAHAQHAWNEEAGCADKATALHMAILALEATCKTENDEEKPPKGIEPYWVVIPERIDNLAETIKRYSGRKDGKVETWAAEIVALRKVQELLDKEYGR